MCGVLGAVSPEIRQPGEFYQFLSNLFIASEIRGRDASGFAALCNKEFITDKRDVRAHDLTHLSKNWRSIRRGGAISLIGHTRAATNGDPKYNANNHPFHGPRYSMVHNGGVSLFRTIARDFNFKLKTSCDSELILHFLESKDKIRDGIIETLNWLDPVSMMAVCTLDRETGIVHLFCERSGPMVVVKFKRWNATVFASNIRIIQSAMSETTGSKTNNHLYGNLVYGQYAPDYTHIQILPDGSIKDENLEGILKIESTYAYSNHHHMMGWDIGVFNGGTSKFERESETGGSNKTIAGDVPREDSELENSLDSFRCVRCKKDIRDAAYRGAIHETGPGHMCAPCYLCWDGRPLDEDSSSNIDILDHLRQMADADSEITERYGSGASNTTDSPETRGEFINKMRKLFPIELRIGLGEDIAYWGRIAEAVEKERTPIEDYDLDSYKLQQFFNCEALSNDEKVKCWTDMTLAKMKEMDDGEYLSYYNLIYDALNVV